MAGTTDSTGAPVPGQGDSTAPVTVETTSNTQEPGGQTEGMIEDQTDPEKEPRTFTQEELDRIVAKERAKAERKARRELTAPQHQQQQVSHEPLTLEQFGGDLDALVEAKAAQKAQELVQQRQVQAQRSEIDKTFDERIDAAMDKYDDFAEVAFGSTHNVTPEMAETIKTSEIGPEIAYWLGLNPAESNRIAALPPLQQARELGKIEAKLIAEPPAPKRKASSAPAPINPVTARGSSAQKYDTTDPRSIKTMTDSEWIKAENERLARKAQNR